jgi:hypothetical protein
VRQNSFLRFYARLDRHHIFNACFPEFHSDIQISEKRTVSESVPVNLFHHLPDFPYERPSGCSFPGNNPFGSFYLAKKVPYSI